VRAAIVFCGFIVGNGVINRWIYTKAIDGWGEER
jgi:hypothetical protein